MESVTLGNCSLDAILPDYLNNHTSRCFWIDKIRQDMLMDNFVHTTLHPGKNYVQMVSSSNGLMDQMASSSNGSMVQMAQ